MGVTEKAGPEQTGGRSQKEGDLGGPSGGRVQGAGCATCARWSHRRLQAPQEALTPCDSWEVENGPPGSFRRGQWAPGSWLSGNSRPPRHRGRSGNPEARSALKASRGLWPRTQPPSHWAGVCKHRPGFHWPPLHPERGWTRQRGGGTWPCPGPARSIWNHVHLTHLLWLLGAGRGPLRLRALPGPPAHQYPPLWPRSCCGRQASRRPFRLPRTWCHGPVQNYTFCN